MTKTTTSTAIRRVLAPVDGSALSEAILDPLERLLDPAQPATVFLLEVLDRDRGAPDQDAAIERVRDYLGRVERRFRDPHVAFELHVRAGDAAEQILAMSEEVDVDLIAMSTLGRDGVERWVAGSVTERVLRQAKAPVLLANPGDATRWEEGFRRVLVPLDGSRRSEAILPRVETVARRFGSEVVLFHAVEHDE